MMCSSYEKNNSQPCLEQQNEMVIANSCKYSALKQNNEDNLVNALLIKESEVSALKEVIDKWRTRALEAESASSYYCEQIETMQAQYENEIIAIEEEYIHKLNEKDDIIFGLKQELHYFAGKASQNDSLEDLMDEFDNMSMMESVYDRNVEQSFTSFNSDNTPSCRQKMKSEDILDSIQDTVKAIEQELGIHLDTKPKYRRSLSASTLIEASPNETSSPTKVKKAPFYSVFKSLPKVLRRKTYHSLIKKNDRFPCKQPDQPITLSNTTNHSKTVSTCLV